MKLGERTQQTRVRPLVSRGWFRPGRLGTRVRSPLPIVVVVGLSIGCAAPGPTTWPTKRQHTRSARKAELAEGPEWAVGLIHALNLGDVQTVRAQLAPRLHADDLESRLAQASQRLSAEFGAPVGVSQWRVHREGQREWFSALVVHARRLQKRLVLYQFGRDGPRVARLLVREHPFREQVRFPPEDYLTVNRFRFPAREEWTVIQGGRTQELNKHHGHRKQRYAYDAVIKKGGRSRPAGPKQNERYYAHGEVVVSPAPGTVIFARNHVPENVAGERGKGGGNGVLIDHGFGEFTALWHMIPGTITVEVGDEVEWGQPLGKCGNTGHSTQPHIHFEVTSGPPDTKQRFALPAEIADAWIDGAWTRQAMPRKKQRVKAHEERPPPSRPLQHPAIVIDL